MSGGTAKVAISMPREIFRSVERTRRRLHLARSEAVVKALEAWLRQLEERVAVQRYIAGYRRHPERLSPVEAKARLKLTAAVFRKDAPWS